MENDLNKEIGERIRQLRTEKKMSQIEFSSLVGVKQATLSGYERGAITPTVEVLTRIALECHISLNWLCGITSDSMEKELGNPIKTYADILFFFIKLEYGNDFTLKQESITNLITMLDIRHEEIAVVGFKDPGIIDMIKDWKKIRELFNSGAINHDLYETWLNLALIKYDTPLPNANKMP